MNHIIRPLAYLLDATILTGAPANLELALYSKSYGYAVNLLGHFGHVTKIEQIDDVMYLITLKHTGPPLCDCKEVPQPPES